ncbi:MAG: alginate lyase family protein [Deltaproteobacteria bacterium]|nr:alginate lyase family protein [Deltaproteobacteria bacterium]
MKNFFIFLCVSFLSFSSNMQQCFSSDDSNQFKKKVFLNLDRIPLIQEYIVLKKEPVYSEFQRLLSESYDYLDGYNPEFPKQWFVPYYYENPEGHEKKRVVLEYASNRAYALALAFHLTGDLAFAQKARTIILKWITTTKDLSKEEDSKLSFCVHFPLMIFAADLLRPTSVWTNTDEKCFSNYLGVLARPMSTMDKNNNWGNWGSLLSLSIGTYLEHEELYLKTSKRWKQLIGIQIDTDGRLIHEVNRSEGQRGIRYSHYSLLPATIAAMIAWEHGEDFFHYRSPNNRTLHMAFKKIAFWARYPAQFPYYKGPIETLKGIHNVHYFEILSSMWPEVDALELLGIVRPLPIIASDFRLSLTHPKSLNDIIFSQGQK